MFTQTAHCNAQSCCIKFFFTLYAHFTCFSPIIFNKRDLMVYLRYIGLKNKYIYLQIYRHRETQMEFKYRILYLSHLSYILQTFIFLLQTQSFSFITVYYTQLTRFNIKIYYCSPYYYYISRMFIVYNMSIPIYIKLTSKHKDDTEK